MRASIISAIIGVILIIVVLWAAFETLVLARRVTRQTHLTRYFYRATWLPWSALVRSTLSGRHRENLLSIYGPVSLLLLLSFWACILIFGFGLLFWGSGLATTRADQGVSLGTALYFGGTTFFTLGLGDERPITPFARLLTVVEAGVGFGFLAMVIGYLPALSQSFSKREVNISLLDARAGSPPTAAEMLRRYNDEYGMVSIRELLRDWELWSAELLESHLSYPMLAYFRSQHDNQSWLSALTSILDVSALVMVGLEGACTRQAQLTFAIARHAVVDLSLVFRLRPRNPEQDRLPPEELANLRATLLAAGLRPQAGAAVDRQLAELRQMYEPYLHSLSHYFYLSLPPWISQTTLPDNWQGSPWDRGMKVESRL